MRPNVGDGKIAKDSRVAYWIFIYNYKIKCWYN